MTDEPVTSVPDSDAADAELRSWLAGLPKVELHVHLVGSASVPTVLELARRHPDGGVPTDEQALRDFYAFTDFAHFSEVYIAVDSLVRTADDIEAVATGVLADLAAQQVRYVELTVTPDSHLLKGVEPDGVAEALVRARARARSEHGLEVGWILDIPGELGWRRGFGPSTGWSARRRRAPSASGSAVPRSGSLARSSPRSCPGAGPRSGQPAARG